MSTKPRLDEERSKGGCPTHQLFGVIGATFRNKVLLREIIHLAHLAHHVMHKCYTQFPYEISFIVHNYLGLFVLRMCKNTMYSLDYSKKDELEPQSRKVLEELY